jgi:hypothetical protein
MDSSEVKFDVVPNINIDLAKKLNNYEFFSKNTKNTLHIMSFICINVLESESFLHVKCPYKETVGVKNLHYLHHKLNIS